MAWQLRARLALCYLHSFTSFYWCAAEIALQRQKHQETLDWATRRAPHWTHAAFGPQEGFSRLLVLTACLELARHAQSSQPAASALKPNFATLSHGLVPGTQSIPRAELTALCVAVNIAAQLPHLPVHIHVDASSALQAARLHLSSSDGRNRATQLLTRPPKQRSLPTCHGLWREQQDKFLGGVFSVLG